jgi:hypothetical protein
LPGKTNWTGRWHPEAATALLEWYYELLKTDFKNFNELKKNPMALSV